jgi:SAM-dependent methyltransferase
VDGATAAQAFHWFDTDRAYPELHRVLRPGGTFAVVLNRRIVETPAQAAMDALRTPLRRGTPSWDDHSWEATLEDPPGFDPRPGPRVRHDHELPLELAVARVASTSFVASLPEDERQEVLDEARRRFAAIAVGDSVTFTYDAEVTWLRREAT